MSYWSNITTCQLSYCSNIIYACLIAITLTHLLFIMKTGDTPLYRTNAVWLLDICCRRAIGVIRNVLSALVVTYRFVLFHHASIMSKASAVCPTVPRTTMAMQKSENASSVTSNACVALVPRLPIVSRAETWNYIKTLNTGMWIHLLVQQILYLFIHLDIHIQSSTSKIKCVYIFTHLICHVDLY